MTLRQVGLKPLHADQSIYVLHEGDELSLIVSCHVDDLKFGGNPQARETFINHLEKNFGKWKTFDHWIEI